jgi:hypothetical protein
MAADAAAPKEGADPKVLRRLELHDGAEETDRVDNEGINGGDPMRRPFRPRTHWIVWLAIVVFAIAALLSFEQGAITGYFK